MVAWILNSKSVGNISEAKSLSRFIELGWIVLIPFGDNEPYDLVIDRGNGFERVQVKTGRVGFSAGSFMFNAFSISERTSGRHFTSYVGKIDLFSVYFRDTDKIYLIPVSVVGGLTQPVFRINPALNCQKTGVRMAVDFEV